MKVPFLERARALAEFGYVDSDFLIRIYECDKQLFEPKDVLTFLKCFKPAVPNVSNSVLGINALKKLLSFLLSNSLVKEYCRHMSIEECKLLIDAQPYFLGVQVGNSANGEFKYAIVNLFFERGLSFLIELLSYLRAKYPRAHAYVSKKVPGLGSWQGYLQLYNAQPRCQKRSGALLIAAAVRDFPNDALLFNEIFLRALKFPRENVGTLIELAKFVHWQVSLGAKANTGSFSGVRLNMFVALLLACTVNFKLAEKGSSPSKKKEPQRKIQAQVEFLLATVMAAKGFEDGMLFLVDDFVRIVAVLMKAKNPKLKWEELSKDAAYYAWRVVNFSAASSLQKIDHSYYFPASVLAVSLSERMTVIKTYKKDKKNVAGWSRIQRYLNEWEFLGRYNPSVEAEDMPLFITCLEDAVLSGGPILKSVLNLYYRFITFARLKIVFQSISKEDAAKDLRDQPKREFSLVLRDQIAAYALEFQGYRRCDVLADEGVKFLAKLKKLPGSNISLLLAYLLSLITVYGGKEQALALFNKPFSATLALLSPGALYTSCGLIARRSFFFSKRLSQLLQTNRKLKKQVKALRLIEFKEEETLAEVLAVKFGQKEFAGWYSPLHGVVEQEQVWGAGQGAGVGAGGITQQLAAEHKRIEAALQQLRAFDSPATPSPVALEEVGSQPTVVGKPGAAANSAVDRREEAPHGRPSSDSEGEDRPRRRGRRQPSEYPGGGAPGPFSSAASLFSMQEESKEQQLESLLQEIESLKQEVATNKAKLKVVNSGAADAGDTANTIPPKEKREKRGRAKRKRKGNGKGFGENKSLQKNLNNNRRKLEEAQQRLREYLDTSGMGAQRDSARVKAALQTMEQELANAERNGVAIVSPA
jgi:hypothetical protein